MSTWPKHFRRCLLAALIVAPGLTGVAISAAQEKEAGEVIEQKVPVKQTVATTCVGNVEIAGDILGQFRIKPDGAGGTRVEADFIYNELNATAVKSKDQYRAAGTSHFDSTGQLPMGFNYVANFALNKPNSKESMMGHVKLRIDLRTKDEVTASVRGVEVDCPTR